MDARRTEHLTELAAAGDRAALDQLLQLHLPALRAFVRLRADAALRRRVSTSDLVQSVCREVLEHADRFRYPDESGFRRWLYTTALRTLRDRRDFELAERRDARREVPAEDAALDRALLEHYSRVLTPSRAAGAREQLERVERAMETLPESYREVIALSRVAGLSHAAIASAMGKSEGAVRMLLHRALARLVAVVEGSSGDA